MNPQVPLAVVIDQMIQKTANQAEPCPECGRAVIFVRQIRRWVCRCGWSEKSQ